MPFSASTYALAKKYTDKTVEGLGAIKGANCVVKETKTVDGGTEITFEWTGTSGTKETTTILVKNGEQGNGIAKIEKIKTIDLVDTYRMTFDDGSTFDYEVTNGSSSTGGASTWSEVNDKPFETIGSDFTVVNNELKLADGVGGKIDTVKVNGVELPVVDKAVNIEIPDYIYIGNTEPTDENVVLWVNPDESGGGTGGSGTAEDTTYTNENFPQYDNVDLALDALFNKVYYVKPTCSLSASPNGGTFEMGTVISAPITFTWTTNKDITSQTLTGCTLADANVRTATYNTNVTSDKSFTLSVSDGENFASSSVSYKFLNKVYYGSASEQDSYDSDFILGLVNNKFATSIKGSYPITVESGEFGYIACPKSFNAPSECYIGGFLTTLENAGEISFTNASGGVATYTILRTGKSGLGSLTMEFK